MNRKSILFVLVVFIVGMLLGTALSILIASVLPEGVVKDFFLVNKSIGWGVAPNNWVHLGFLKFKTGLYLDISILSIMGFFISWYLLRYFK